MEKEKESSIKRIGLNLNNSADEINPDISLTSVSPLHLRSENNQPKMRLRVSKTDDYIFELCELTKRQMMGTVSSNSNVFQKNPIKNIVSKKKIRFQYEGFDLDLSYIFPNIIAMGFPASNMDKIFRNALNEVIRFFEVRHAKHYKVYNLCSEKQYEDETFYLQSYYPFDDHEAPPIDLILTFCKDLEAFLKDDPKNVAAIHCKAGKGRTGTFISCFLIYNGFMNSAEDAIKYFGLMRTANGKGITIPSQIRYVYYFEHIIKAGVPYPLPCSSMLISKIILYGVPQFSLLSAGCTPYFKVLSGNSKYCYKESHKLQAFKNEPLIELDSVNCSVKGDVKVIFFHKTPLGKNKMFQFWFNTFFISSEGILKIKKTMLDTACKDIHHKLFPSSFKIKVHFKVDF